MTKKGGPPAPLVFMPVYKKESVVLLIAVYKRVLESAIQGLAMQYYANIPQTSSAVSASTSVAMQLYMCAHAPIMIAHLCKFVVAIT